jgi:hypothetical protein
VLLIIRCTGKLSKSRARKLAATGFVWGPAAAAAGLVVGAKSVKPALKDTIRLSDSSRSSGSSSRSGNTRRSSRVKSGNSSSSSSSSSGVHKTVSAAKAVDRRDARPAVAAAKSLSAGVYAATGGSAALWERGFDALLAWKATHGGGTSCRVPNGYFSVELVLCTPCEPHVIRIHTVRYVDAQFPTAGSNSGGSVDSNSSGSASRGMKLGRWVERQRAAFVRGRLSTKRAQRLIEVTPYNTSTK